MTFDAPNHSGSFKRCVLVQPITRPSSDAAQVDVQRGIEISRSFYWSLWGNQAVAAVDVFRDFLERGNENDETDFSEFPVNKLHFDSYRPEFIPY